MDYVLLLHGHSYGQYFIFFLPRRGKSKVLLPQKILKQSELQNKEEGDINQNLLKR